MKKLITEVVCFYIIMSMVACSGEYDDSILNGRIDNLENRVETLEEFCKQMNTNISSLQILITALQQNDYITNVSEVHQGDKVIGYTVSFSKSKSITIYHGKDGENGKDGVNGKDGKDGASPLVGVKLHSDGCYYWTIDGKWLKDQYGNMIKAQGRDGANGNNGKDGVDGKDGEDGKDGKDGKDGEDGITPKLKIENGYWYISYTNGYSWQRLGLATGNDGDTMFKKIVVGDYCVTFELTDGVTFELPLYSSSHLAIEVKEAGTLKQLLTAEQKRDIVSLSILGTVNEMDIRTIIYQLQNLETLDMSAANYQSSKSIDFSRSDYVVNGKLKEIYFPKFLADKIGLYSGVSLNLSYYPFLETISLSSDSTAISITAKSNNSNCIDKLIYQEGVTILPARSCCANSPTVILPSTIKQIHTSAFGFGTDEQVIDLKTLICKAMTPPEVGEWGYYYPTPSQYSFSSYSANSYYTGSSWKYASECTLKVPAESVELYKQEKYWKNFGSIIPLNE